MFWLCYRVNGQICVFVQRAESLAHARIMAQIADESIPASGFVEGHRLDIGMIPKIPRKMIGRLLCQAEARKLLDRMAA